METMTAVVTEVQPAIEQEMSGHDLLERVRRIAEMPPQEGYTDDEVYELILAAYRQTGFEPIYDTWVGRKEGVIAKGCALSVLSHALGRRRVTGRAITNDGQRILGKSQGYVEGIYNGFDAWKMPKLGFAAKLAAIRQSPWMTADDVYDYTNGYVVGYRVGQAVFRDKVLERDHAGGTSDTAAG